MISSELQFPDFYHGVPFPHTVIDNFWDPDVADSIYSDMSDIEFNGSYDNPFEIKKTCNIWDRFPDTIYKAFIFLSTPEFVSMLRTRLALPDLIADPGLHGGGVHYHPPGGKLNPHVDYSHHPKQGYQRRLNLLMYFNPGWRTGDGGELGLWTPEQIKNYSDPEIMIEPVFNRAVFFESSEHSYHGLARPSNTERRSLAMYYLMPDHSEVINPKAVFVPTAEQRDDPEVHRLAELRKSQRLEQ